MTGGRIAVGAVATALPLAWQIANMAGWVAQNVTSIFENVGVVQDGMRSIAVARQMPDPPERARAARPRGAIRFEDVHFGYGHRARPCCTASISRSRPANASAWSAARAPASRRSSICCCASTTPARGRILIDGQDIAGVTQESLRAQIAMVTQDTSLLHRSIRDNIRYGRPEATDAEVRRGGGAARARPTSSSWGWRIGMAAAATRRTWASAA